MSSLSQMIYHRRVWPSPVSCYFAFGAIVMGRVSLFLLLAVLIVARALFVDARRSSAQERKEVCTLKGHTDSVLALAFSPDGKTLASGSSDGTIKLWEVATCKERETLHADKLAVQSLAFSPAGKKLASGGWDGTVKLWDLSTDKESATLKGHSGYVSAIAFSPDGASLASAGSRDKTVRLWKVSSDKEVTILPHLAAVTSLAFFPDHKTLVSASEDGKITRWEPSTGKAIATFETDALRMALSPDGKTLALSGLGEAKSSSVTLLDAITGKELAVLKAHTQHVTATAFSPGSTILATGSADNTVRLWDVATGKLKGILEGHTLNVRAVAFSPDGRTLASASMDRTIKVWHVSSDGEHRK